jgi:uncharacterized protein (TIGR02611 family)
MPRAPRWIWFPLGAVFRFVVRNRRRILISIAGFGLVALGLVLLVLPGPGFLLIIGGLALLASEYVWAQRALNYARRQAARARDKATGRRGRESDQGA